MILGTGTKSIHVVRVAPTQTSDDQTIQYLGSVVSALTCFAKRLHK